MAWCPRLGSKGTGEDPCRLSNLICTCMQNSCFKVEHFVGKIIASYFLNINFTKKSVFFEDNFLEQEFCLFWPFSVQLFISGICSVTSLPMSVSSLHCLYSNFDSSSQFQIGLRSDPNLLNRIRERNFFRTLIILILRLKQDILFI